MDRLLHLVVTVRLELGVVNASPGCTKSDSTPSNDHRPTQPPTLSGTGNGYQPKGGDALRLRSKLKGRYGSFHLWINVWVAAIKLCDPSLTRAIPERFRDEL